MSTRPLLLLSPYRLPTESTLYLGDEEVAAFLNGHAALWHPATLRLAGEGWPDLAEGGAELLAYLAPREIP